MRAASVLAILLVAGLSLSPTPVQATHSSVTYSKLPFTLTPVYPQPGSTITTELPTIEATFTDNVSVVPYRGVDMIVDGTNVTGFEGLTITQVSVSYVVQSLFPLKEGPNNVTVILTDDRQNSA